MSRVLDQILGASLLVLFAPLMCLLALAVQLESGGPVLVRHLRADEGGRLFRTYAFRIYAHRGEETIGDRPPTLTWTGRFLNATALEELPALLALASGTARLDFTRGIRLSAGLTDEHHKEGDDERPAE
ncbi:MAG: sugar transferase [Alphaproteobacteria bacterium]|nr:sugar transferase [Alphaproteobacteria bacterium]